MNPRRMLPPLLAFATVSFFPGAAGAGCGCDKPPPALAAVRPSVAYAGGAVTLFSPRFAVGEPVTVTFRSGTVAASTAVEAVVELRRDLADGVTKPQVVVPLPGLPLGPAAIAVTDASGAALAAIDDAQFTVAPDPIALPAARGAWHYPGMQAAVGRDGTIYLALDLSGLQEPLVFRAQALGLPLRFAAEDVVFKNAQGFLMQLLVDGKKGKPIPGMSVEPAAAPLLNGDILRYSRHEFATYFLQHDEREAHAVDADGWHTDGTPHIDHDHLIIAIAGRVGGGSLPAGPTLPFDLKITAYSLFHAGLVGIERVEVTHDVAIDSYDPGTMRFADAGRVYSTRLVTVKDRALVRGDVVGASLELGSGVRITGEARHIDGAPASFMQVKAPAGIPTLGKIALDDGRARLIAGPGTFLVEAIKLVKGSELVIDNTRGPVTLYVKGEVTADSGSRIVVIDPAAESFAIYLSGDKAVKLAGDGSLFAGVVYAPRSTIEIKGTSEFSGAFVGKEVKVNDRARVHFDSTLAPTASDAPEPIDAAQ